MMYMKPQTDLSAIMTPAFHWRPIDACAESNDGEENHGPAEVLGPARRVHQVRQGPRGPRTADRSGPGHPHGGVSVGIRQADHRSRLRQADAGTRGRVEVNPDEVRQLILGRTL